MSRPRFDAGHDPTDALGLGTGEMRMLGYWVVDRVAEHFEAGGDGPVIRAGAPEELRAVIGGPVPRPPGDPRLALQTLLDTALANMQHGGHPRYFARVPGPSAAFLAALAADGVCRCDQHQPARLAGPAPVHDQPAHDRGRHH